jgi:AbrB family looped-hinge helix DNA binding protein
MSRMTSKGQVTVPADVRYALGLGPGDEIVFAVEGGRGTLRRAVAIATLAATFPGAARPEAHPLERLLVDGDLAFAAAVGVQRAAGRRLRLPDAVLLDIAAALVARGAARADVAAALRDVLAERALRSDFPAAVRAAVGELAAGGDPLRAYALARG